MMGGWKEGVAGEVQWRSSCCKHALVQALQQEVEEETLRIRCKSIRVDGVDCGVI